jgi:IS30 family transposase
MYTHLTEKERDHLALWHGQGHSIRWIARQLTRSHATIIRELRRNRSTISGVYVAIAAQRRAADRAVITRRRHPLKQPWVYSYVFKKLRAGWSPEQISGRLELEHGYSVICKETIYQFVYKKQNKEKKLWEYLPRKQKHRKKQHGRSVQKERIPQRVSIHDRPKAIDTRQQFGHWEGDTVEGKRSDGDGIHTEVERMTRFFLARRVDRIASAETIRAQYQLFQSIQEQARRSTTLDNGREHHRHMALRFLKMRTYFADSYASWQRATNENTNGLLRRYLPKGSSFQDLSQEELDDMVEELNNRPRKCLGYNTPREKFEEQLRWCTSN